MTIKYPSVLPKPIRKGYSREYLKKMASTKMDDGNHRTRRKTVEQAFIVSVTWKFNSHYLAVFESFGQIVCKYWTEWFELELSPNFPPVVAKIVGDSPQVSKSGLDWEVTASIMYIEGGPVPTGAPALVAWPATLPWPESNNYSYQVGNFRIEDDPKVGLPRSRSRFASQTTFFTATWVLNQTERDVFWNFIRNKLLDGCIPFMLPFQNGLGISYLRCNIMGQPKESAESSGYKIQMGLSTMFAPVMTESELMVALNAYIQSDYATNYFAEDYTAGVLIYD